MPSDEVAMEEPSATKRPPAKKTRSIELRPLGVQVMPSGEDRMDCGEPPEPTPVVATIIEDEAATEVRALLVGGGCRVQLVPSGDVTIVPALPTAMNWLPVHATLLRLLVAGELRVSQERPSGEVWMVPCLLTAT